VAQRDLDGVDQAITLYRRAAALAPGEPLFAQGIGIANLRRALLTSDEAGRQPFWLAAEEALLSAREVQPLAPESAANLARLYATWSQVGQPDEQADLVAKANDYYAAATGLNPASGLLWNERARFVARTADDCRQVMALYEQSAAHDPFFAQTYFALAQARLACQPPDGVTLRAASAALRQGLERWAASGKPELWEALAAQYDDAASFEVAFAAENERLGQVWARAAAALDRAEAALAADDLAAAGVALDEAATRASELG
jgi:hypothetical protein